MKYLCVILIVLCFIGCNSYRPIQNEHNLTNTQTSSEVNNHSSVVRDSVVWKDKIVYRERIKNDTVYIETTVEKYRDHNVVKHDTTYICKTDTVRVTEYVNVVVEKKRNWIKDLWWLWILVLVGGIGYAVKRMLSK